MPMGIQFTFPASSMDAIEDTVSIFSGVTSASVTTDTGAGDGSCSYMTGELLRVFLALSSGISLLLEAAGPAGYGHLGIRAGVEPGAINEFFLRMGMC